jgi:hypothetical protein
MFVRKVAALFLTFGSLSKDTVAELITITQYASTCSAIYTTGTRSVTTIQSTTTVVSVPHNDAAWNGGSPFVLEIDADTASDPLPRRVDLTGRFWVTLNGSTSTDPSFAGQYYIRGGQLMSINGSYVSTNLNVQSQPFSISSTPGSISTSFTFKDGVLNWTSPRFIDGRAKFCKLPVSLVDDAQVLCQFLGPVQYQKSCSPIRLHARPCEKVHPSSLSSAMPTDTVGISTSKGIESMSGEPPGQYSPPPYTYQPLSSSSGVVSTPAGYTSATFSSAVSSVSPIASDIMTRSTGASSSALPPVYGSRTPSRASTFSSVSPSASITFASSGSPIRPINPPIYGSASSDSSSKSSSSSVSLSSGSVRTSASSTSSSVELPPVYPSRACQCQWLRPVS